MSVHACLYLRTCSIQHPQHLQRKTAAGPCLLLPLPGGGACFPPSAAAAAVAAPPLHAATGVACV